MIQVVKRDQHVEPFCADKLRLCFWRAMTGPGASFCRAHHLSRAVVVYLRRKNISEVTSRALFEMAVRALRQTRHDRAADQLETHHRRRREGRRSLAVVGDGGEQIAWSRTWLTEQIQRRWEISRAAARAIGADIEADVLDRGADVSDQWILDMIDERVENYGLAPWCLLATAPML